MAWNPDPALFMNNASPEMPRRLPNLRMSAMPQLSDSPDSRWLSVRRVTAVGEPLLELQPSDGEVRLAFGGDVANSMACLARMVGSGQGVRISLLSALGNSGYSDWLRERLQRAGIEVIEAQRDGEPGLYGLPLGANRPPGFSYWRVHSAAGRFLRSVGRGELAALLGEPDVLLVTGITLALCSDASFNVLCRWIEQHRSACRIVFDVNFRARLWESPQKARERIGALEALADLIATGGEDEQALWSCADHAAVRRRLGGYRAECLIREGAAGCWVGSGEHWQQLATVAVRALDTAGAGDSHLAGYLAARMCGYACAEAAAYANSAASLIVAQRGSAPRPGLVFPPLTVQASGSTS